MDKKENPPVEVQVTIEEGNPDPDVVVGKVRDFIYANVSYSSMSNWDARLTFCERIPSGEVVPRVSIVMPHQQAKALSEMLASQVKKLEEIFGEIRWQAPPKREQK